MIGRAVDTQGREFTAHELVELLKQQAAVIANLEYEVARLSSDLTACHSQQDPYQVACEIAAKEAPSNDDMRRLRAAEVAIAYCGRPKISESRSMSVVGYGDVNGIAARLEKARLRVINGGNRVIDGGADMESADPPTEPTPDPT